MHENPEARLIARHPKADIFLLNNRIHVFNTLTNQHMGAFHNDLLQVLDFDDLVSAIIYPDNNF